MVHINILYSRFEKVGIWAWDDLGWCSFFSRLWGWETVIFQLYSFYCIGTIMGYGRCPKNCGSCGPEGARTPNRRPKCKSSKAPLKGFGCRIRQA